MPAEKGVMARLRRWVAGRDSSVEVSEERGVRYLHLGGDAIQSAIRLSQPDALELHYTRAMMGFMLFEPAPRDLLMIGLGGGSIPRFVHARLPTIRTTAIEINPRVLAAARTYFGLPQDDERLTVLIEDGAAYVPAHPFSTDVLLLDAFHDGEAVTQLCSAEFYDHCYAALRDGGVFVQNFMADEPRFGRYVDRLVESFDGRVLCMPTADEVNTMVFGLKRDGRRVSIDDLKRAAAKLERRHGLPFVRMAHDLVAGNERTASYLVMPPAPAT